MTTMRILVLEDETRILSFLSRGLGAAGYTVVGETNGRKGLALALDSVWDLLILDLLLPGLNGLEVLRAVRRERPGLPVLVLSARSDLTTKLLGFELGASDYVPKPFSLDELIARVRVQLRQTATDDRSLIRGRRLTLDVARRSACIGDLVCDLSDREFHLLRHLLLHEGEVISRTQLLSDVWGYGFDPGSNVVEVCVRRLRKKLGPKILIETVRNAGYRLAA